MRTCDAPQIDVLPIMLTTYYPKLSETFIFDFVRILATRTRTPQVMSLLEADDVRTMDLEDQAPTAKFSIKPQVPLATTTRGYAQLPTWARQLLLAQSACAYDVRQITAKLEQLLAQRMSVLHVHFLSPPGTIAATLLERQASPSVLELHGYDVFRIARSMPDSSYQVLRRFDKIIVNSEYMRRMLCEEMEGMDRRPELDIVVVPPGIDLAKVRRAGCDHPKSPDHVQYKLVTVGRLIEKKGVHVLLEALPVLLQSQPETVLHIVGSGPEEQKLSRYVERCGLERNVVFHGALSRSMTLEIVCDADIFVLPCIEAKNGDLDSTPIVLLEAQALGVPVISSRISGVPEVVVDGGTGLLTEAGNALDLVKAIAHLCGDIDRRRAMSARARTFAYAKFCIEDRCDRVCDIYSDLRRNHHRRSR